MHTAHRGAEPFSHCLRAHVRAFYSTPRTTAMLCATVALFATYVSTLAIETVCQGPNDELFEHESASGVNQTAEIAARMLGDVLSWAPLPLVFTLPFATLANIGEAMWSIIGILFFLQWAMQPIGCTPNEIEPLPHTCS